MEAVEKLEQIFQHEGENASDGDLGRYKREQLELEKQEERNRLEFFFFDQQ